MTESFKDESKARDYYTDMLVKYPDADVQFIKDNYRGRDWVNV